jgi:serine protease
MTYAGVAPGAQVITIKTGGGTGTDGPKGWPINSVVDALNYVYNGLLPRGDVGPKIVAVNISANGNSIAGTSPCATGGDGDRIDTVAARLKAKGIAVVMAAGDDAVNGTGTWNCGKNVIPVGATGVVSPTTPTTYTNISQQVGLFAPVGTADRPSGDLILAPWAGAGSFYVWGTSFASPQVAAASAVLRQKFGTNPSVDALADLMKRKGNPLTGSRAGLAAQGASVLNIGAALNSAP